MNTNTLTVYQKDLLDELNDILGIKFVTFLETPEKRRDLEQILLSDANIPDKIVATMDLINDYKKKLLHNKET
ncbi:hypothetical protein EON71_00130 [bacterium]|nr:MAG: hypothetical protein EON71_00130 [bacterium]